MSNNSKKCYLNACNFFLDFFISPLKKGFSCFMHPSRGKACLRAVEAHTALVWFFLFGACVALKSWSRCKKTVSRDSSGRPVQGHSPPGSISPRLGNVLALVWGQEGGGVYRASHRSIPHTGLMSDQCLGVSRAVGILHLCLAYGSWDWNLNSEASGQWLFTLTGL